MHLPDRFIPAVGIVLLVTSFASVVISQQCGTGDNTARNNIVYPMYMNSRPQDSRSCSLTVKDGRLEVAAPVSNPAMSCPDMFAWKLYADVIQQEFWKNWAADPQTWPASPLPMCANGAAGAACCLPGGQSNPGYNNKTNPAQNCPYFPGDHLADFGGFMIQRGFLPSKAHELGLAKVASQRAPMLAVEPGRKIRQSMAEIVFRNKTMFRFVFENDLYNQEGIMAVFNANAQNLQSGAPYRATNGVGPGHLTEIDFPPDAIMIKSNWLSRERAEQLGLRDDPSAPYIKMTITSPVTDNNGSILQPGEHWLVALHISSKDIPQWHWLTFEHVNNPGRCDYTGCNDSYGFSSADMVKVGQAKNFTTPHVVCDKLDLPAWVFDTAKPYPSGPINPELQQVLSALGIGTKPEVPPVNRKDGPTYIPHTSDEAWLSYRLKGAQNSFVDNVGHATHLANSVTEGGFVSSSSCVTCHSRAGSTSKGTLPPALGVFLNQVGDEGYFESARGIPDEYWFFKSRTPLQLDVLQTDFVWGFLSANPLKSAAALAAPQGTQPIPAGVRGRTGTE